MPAMISLCVVVSAISKGWRCDCFGDRYYVIDNTRCDFVADKPGSYDVSYYVTDHNGGYAIGVVQITFKVKTLWSDINCA